MSRLRGAEKVHVRMLKGMTCPTQRDPVIDGESFVEEVAPRLDGKHFERLLTVLAKEVDTAIGILAWHGTHPLVAGRGR